MTRIYIVEEVLIHKTVSVSVNELWTILKCHKPSKCLSSGESPLSSLQHNADNALNKNTDYKETLKKTKQKYKKN